MNNNPYGASQQDTPYTVTPEQDMPDHDPFAGLEAEKAAADAQVEQTAEQTSEQAPPKEDDSQLRLLAEMENFKRRVQRDYEEQNKYAAEKVLADMLPGLDSLDLAIKYADKDKDASLVQGVIMTRKLLLDALKNHGLEPVGEEGEPYSHELHEAVGQEERDDLPDMHVSSLLQRGYKLKERLLRPAKVMVSRSKG